MSECLTDLQARKPPLPISGKSYTTFISAMIVIMKSISDNESVWFTKLWCQNMEFSTPKPLLGSKNVRCMTPQKWGFWYQTRFWGPKNIKRAQKIEKNSFFQNWPILYILPKILYDISEPHAWGPPSLEFVLSINFQPFGSPGEWWGGGQEVTFHFLVKLYWFVWNSNSLHLDPDRISDPPTFFDFEGWP